MIAAQHVCPSIVLEMFKSTSCSGSVASCFTCSLLCNLVSIPALHVSHSCVLHVLDPSPQLHALALAVHFSEFHSQSACQPRSSCVAALVPPLGSSGACTHCSSRLALALYPEVPSRTAARSPQTHTKCSPPALQIILVLVHGVLQRLLQALLHVAAHTGRIQGRAGQRSSPRQI